MNQEQKRLNPSASQGLLEEQVLAQKQAGLQNTAPEPISRTTGQIVKDNVCTLFNLFNLLIALALAAVQAWSNLFFMAIIILNTAIGIFQEIKAKKLVDKLSLLSLPKAEVVRGGRAMAIPVEELVLDDVLLLESGRQVCADAILLEGEVEVNESLLTGESDPVGKQAGDLLLSGSFVVSGKCRARVEHVGSANYATKIAEEARAHRKVHSELLSSMRKVTRFTGYFILPLGILLFIQAYFLRGDLLSESVIGTAAGLLGMLPKGLVLLISIALAAGVISLAKKDVLVQELYALETLAHVDVLCLDKTGTITEGRMQVEEEISLNGQPEEEFQALMGSFLAHTDDNNATFQALSAFYKKSDALAPASKVAFSSQRKWSAMSFQNGQTLVLGAPERLCPENALPSKVQEQVERGSRVILAGLAQGPVGAELPLPAIQPLRAIVIADAVRPNAAQTLEYFKKEGVAIKVISGDNPKTVSAIAAAAGLEGAERYLDLSQLKTQEELEAAAEQYTVFGRVSPHQKKQLVQALQKAGHQVAMTGDGVNDILALREADCSIAIGEGSDAARQVSQLVLLDSDFASLPDVLAEGRRVVNNITRVASIFFVKTIYSAILSVICILANTPFPFVPIQITLIDLAIEGYPTLFMSFEPDGRKVTSRFLPSVMRRALPNALTIVADVLLVWALAPVLGIPEAQGEAIMYLLVGLMGVAAVFKSCWPFNKLRAFLFTTMTLGFYAAVFLFRDLLHVSLPSMSQLPFLLALAAGSLVLERLLALLVNAIMKRKKAGAQ